jgi:hypothetical protein
MKIIDLSSSEGKLKTFFRLLSIICIIVIAITTIYGVIASIIQGVEVVGLTLVTIEFPPISAFPLFYSKPVTWLSAAVIALWFSTLYLNKERITKLSKPVRNLLKFFAFFIAAMAFYEVLFNFTYWSGQMAADAIRLELDPDIIINPFPNPDVPWSIVFATKIFSVVMIISLYSFFYLQKIEDKL